MFAVCEYEADIRHFISSLKMTLTLCGRLFDNIAPQQKLRFKKSVRAWAKQICIPCLLVRSLC